MRACAGKESKYADIFVSQDFYGQDVDFDIGHQPYASPRVHGTPSSTTSIQPVSRLSTCLAKLNSLLSDCIKSSLPSAQQQPPPPTVYPPNVLFTTFLPSSHRNEANALHPTLNNSLNASSYNAMATHHLRPSRLDASRK